MYSEVFRNSNLLVYFIGRFISSIGNHFLFFAQSIAAYVLTESLSGVGLLWVIRGVSSLLLIPVGGIFADKYDRKKIILSTDVISGFISLSYIFLTPTNHYWLLPLLAFLSQAINRLFEPASRASFKEVSKNVDLEISGSFSAILGQLTVIIGPLLASIIYVVTSKDLTMLFVIDSFTFFFSFFLMLFVDFGTYEKKKPSPNMFFKNIKEGIKIIDKNKSLMFLIIMMVPIALSGKVFEVLILNISEQKWGFGSIGGLGVYMAIFALGGIFASFQIKKYKIHLDNIKFYNLFTFLSGLLFILLGVMYQIYFSLIVTFLLGIVLNFTVIMAQINIQKTVDSAYLGRVFAAWTFVSVLGGGAGAYMSGLLSDLYGTSNTLVIIGLLIILPFIVHMFFQQIRTKRTTRNKYEKNI